jgi:hypothetical protein
LASRLSPTNLWRYARDLLQQDAFRATTRFDTFTRPGAEVPNWDEPIAT